MLAVAPDGIVEAVLLANDTHRLVRVVQPEPRLVAKHLALADGQAPELDSNVLMAAHLRLIQRLPAQRDRLAIKVCARRLPSKPKDGRRQINMRGHHLRHLAARNPRPAHNQRDVDILLKPALLPRLQPMLANMVPIIRRIKNIRLLQQPLRLELLHDRRHQLINTLQRPQPLTIEVVIKLNILLRLPRQRAHPAGAADRLGVEVGRARDRDVLEEVRVPRGGDGRGEAHEGFDVVQVVRRALEGKRLDVAVRRDGRDAEEEGAGAVGGRVGEEAEGFLGEHIDRVLALVADGGRAVALVGRVEVVVSVGVEEEVGAVPAGGVGGVEVFGRVRVEELARVVGVVAGLLEPDGEVGVVEALVDELGVAACGLLVFRIPFGTGLDWYSPYGGFTSVTLVLCARRPVSSDTRAGQQMAVVQ